MIETASVLLLVTLGLALTYFGYEAAEALLYYGGMAAGIAVGCWVGLGILPRVAGGQLTTAEILAVTAVLALVGAAIGRQFIPNLGRLAVGLLGFSLTAIAALVLFSRGQTMEIVTQTLPTAIETGDPDLFADRLANLEYVGGLEPEIALAGIVLLAALGGSLALAHKLLILAAGVTVLGALLLAVTIPLLTGGPALDSTAVTTTFSEFWFIFFVVTGLIFEGIRYSEEMDPSNFVGI